MNPAADFPRLLTLFFTERLMQQRQASPHTIASYRTMFRLLVRYVQRELNKPPSAMALDDFDTALLGDFLSHLETERRNDARTRNTRLAALRSFFRFVALHEPRYAALAQRVLAIPDKRYTRRPVAFLERDEIDVLLRAPDPRTRTGRRDRTLLLVAVQTGLRASELIGLRCKDVQLGTGAHVRCHGKGRKERCAPLRKDSAAALRAWLRERRGEPRDPLFPNQRGGSLSHDSLEYLLAKHLATARAHCPALKNKRVTVHSLRHSCAMQLLHSGVDRAVIALWLGHESVKCRARHLTDNAEKLLMPNDVQESADSSCIPQHALGINFGPQFSHRVVLPCNNKEDNQCLPCLTTSPWCRPHGSISMPSFLSSFTNSAVRGHPKATFLSIRAQSATS